MRAYRVGIKWGRSGHDAGFMEYERVVTKNAKLAVALAVLRSLHRDAGFGILSVSLEKLQFVKDTDGASS